MKKHERWAASGVVALMSGLGVGCESARSARPDGTIITEVMTHSEVAENLTALSMKGGRLSGSDNGTKAEAYVFEKLNAYGLTHVHYEPFEMLTWCDRSTVVTVLDEPPWPLEPAQALGGTLSTPPEGVTAEVVDVGKGTETEFTQRKDELAGRFALAHYGEAHRSEKMKLALQHDAVGLFHISHLEDQVVVGNCHKDPSAAPGIAIGKTAGTALANRLAAGETIRVNVKIEADAWQAKPRNVVGEIRGQGPNADEVVILCGHLDSWHLAQGALDNGTGCAVILEVARVLAQVDPPPSRTIRFVFFMGEEHGLHGSTAYVAAHEDELDRIVAVVNLDMPGEPRRFVTFGHPEIEPFLQSLCADLPGYAMSDTVGNSVGAWSDHAPFMKQGICAVTISGDLGPGVKYYHTPGDTLDQVDQPAVNGCAAVAGILVRRLADADPFPGQRLDPAALQDQYGW